MVDLRTWKVGQRGRSSTGGEQLRRRSLLTYGGQGAIPAMARSGVEGGGLGEMPGLEAELLWWVAGAGTQRGGGFTAA